MSTNSLERSLDHSEMESTPVGGLGSLLLSLALAAGIVAFIVLILRGIFEALKGLITQSKDD